ncbi:hypothetical protein CK203_064917 [Vitis vinifera]|uniref:Uncharacterized protein n=1 Tax=Vitis vinifera TaxID=29760 RepID=A0A438FPP7_VITVI|nr:hypothetical protein CK203_064917 [Vitis vinifera]
MRGIAAGEDRYDWSPPRVSTPSPLDWKRSDEAYALPEKRERRDQSAPQSCLTGKAYAFQGFISSKVDTSMFIFSIASTLIIILVYKSLSLRPSLMSFISTCLHLLYFYVIIQYTPSEEQLLDAMTKALTAARFSGLCCELIVLP